MTQRKRKKTKRKVNNPMILVDANLGPVEQAVEIFEKDSEIVAGLLISGLTIALGIGMLMLAIQIGFRF